MPAESEHLAQLRRERAEEAAENTAALRALAASMDDGEDDR